MKLDMRKKQEKKETTAAEGNDMTFADPFDSAKEMDPNEEKEAEKEAEENMVKTYGSELASLVLKSPHHGSRTSSSEAFLKQVDAKTVLISLGAGNEYGHPHKQTMERYKKLGMKVYETDKDGSITITSDGSKDYKITTEKLKKLDQTGAGSKVQKQRQILKENTTFPITVGGK